MKTEGTSRIWKPSTTSESKTYKTAMNGATICATLAIRFTPPITTKPMSKATMAPAQAGLM